MDNMILATSAFFRAATFGGSSVSLLIEDFEKDGENVKCDGTTV
jgi:hypothetical protein